ncbi:hypothetical protein AGMMS50230_22850 [Spirochaetia bacterium]|nr:hypothetical protein AGMMS50230_22850 [Spirochaetia bacterium]
MTAILLDTNAYKQYLLGNTDLTDIVADSDIAYLSAVVIGELYAGFCGGTKYKENVEKLKYVLDTDNIETLDITPETAEIFGEIKAALKKKGKMIPINDIWIAAQTIETGSKLVTLDTHFKNIGGIRVLLLSGQ